MSEQDPSMSLNLGNGGEFEATPENTSLFRFVGQLAMYDHIFIVFNEEEGRGTYVFRNHEVFPRMEEYMVENQYPTHDNLRQVADCDQEAYDQMIQQHLTDLDGGVPESWG